MTELWEIVQEWLQKNNYDGLVDANGECACSVSELMPCDEPKPDCVAGHKEKVDPATGFDFRIVPGLRE